MDLLILGGTVFLGRHLVDAALAAGHQVTLFNRGQHGAELFPQVEKLRGDLASVPLRAGMALAREAELLAAWEGHAGNPR